MQIIKFYLEEYHPNEDISERLGKIETIYLEASDKIRNLLDDEDDLFHYLSYFKKTGHDEEAEDILSYLSTMCDYDEEDINFGLTEVEQAVSEALEN